MRMHRLALPALLLGACWVDNSRYRAQSAAPLDASAADEATQPAVPDLSACASYPLAGGGGAQRPQVLVPGGKYSIAGVSYAVPDFYLDVFLVTVAAYRDCVQGGGDGGAAGCTPPATGSFCNYSAAPGSSETHPVNCVTWAQAQAFCQWAGRRLPGEGEWQYAAAGARMSTYPWGGDAPQMGAAAQLCWGRYGSSAPLGTCPVGSSESTLLGGRTCNGVADLSGDVWEWTGSEYNDPYVFPETPCSASSMYCSLRGGSWSDFTVTNFQAATRNSDTPSDNLSAYGFRCAASAR